MTDRAANIRIVPRRRWLAVLCALLALVQTGSALNMLAVPADLSASVSLLPPFEFVAGFVWAVALMGAALRLFWRAPFGLRLAAGLLAGFSLYSVIRLALFARADYDRQRLPFLVVTASVILAWAVWVWLRSPQIRSTET